MLPSPANSPAPLDPAKRLFPFKLWYAFYFAAHYTQLFLPLIFNKVMNFSPAVIGSLTASRRFATFLTAPLFAWMCDATLQHRSFLAVAHSLYYLASLSLCFLRSVPSVFIAVLLRDAFVSGCEPTVDNAALATLDDISERRCDADPPVESPDGTSSASSSAATASSAASHDGYGNLRVWGSVGWGLASFGGGFLVDHVFHSNLLFILYIHCLLGCVVVGIILFAIDLSPSLFRRQAQRKLESASASSSSSSSAMGSFPMGSPAATFTAVCALGQGIVLGVLQLTSFIYFSGLGVTTASLGLSVLLSCIAEGTVFRLQRRLTALVGGPMAAMRVSLATSGTMLVLFSLIRFAPVAAPWFIAVSMCNGGSYALFRMSALAVINDIAPPGLASTAQGALQSLSMGVGPAIGSFVAGMAYQAFGVPVLFVCVATMQFFLCLLPALIGVEVETAAARGGAEAAGRTRLVTRVDADERQPLMQHVRAEDGQTAGA